MALLDVGQDALLYSVVCCDLAALGILAVSRSVLCVCTRLRETCYACIWLVMLGMAAGMVLTYYNVRLHCLLGLSMAYHTIYAVLWILGSSIAEASSSGST